jgi:hypothetical protein
MRPHALELKSFILLNLARRRSDINTPIGAGHFNLRDRFTMVIASLAGAHPLRNEDDDVSRLAGLFHILFKHYTSYSSPMATELIQALRTLVGLGFTACLANNALITNYQIYLNRFFDYDHGDFRNHPGALIFLSEAISNMVMLAIQNFRKLPYSGYDKIFFRTIEKITGNVVFNSVGKTEEAKQIFSRLQSKLK